MGMAHRLTWCEVSRDALASNIKEFRRLVGPKCRLAPVVKANAYGHGLELASQVFAEAGADALCVNDLWEAARLRRAGLTVPIIVLGRVTPEQAEEAVSLAVELVVYDCELADALNKAGTAVRQTAQVHLKVETGTNRQGMKLKELIRLADHLRSLRHIEVVGLSTHFADIEDTTDHTFARSQLSSFNEACKALHEAGLSPRYLNVANSAATILWPEAHFDMVRIGIAAYGMWPSRETLVAAALTNRDRVELRPALTWKTRIAQIKQVSAGEYVGYGRTWRAGRDSRIAVLPVGYYDGYDRRLSQTAHVLINGKRAQVRGRVCMNMVMVDVTDIPEAYVGMEVVLLGRSGDERLSAEQLALWIGTINYEVTTRIAESVPRVLV